jgi:hypothetical protein
VVLIAILVLQVVDSSAGPVGLEPTRRNTLQMPDLNDQNQYKQCQKTVFL